MWRKQDESKPPSPVQETKPPQLAETPGRTAAARASVPASHLTSLLTIKGELTGRDDLLIDGQVQGKICIENGRVSIGPNGRVTADIEAREIVVDGRVKGRLQGQERVQIGSAGRASGEVRTRRLRVEEGAEIHGNVDVTRAQEQRATRVSPVSGGNEGVRPVAMQAKESSGA